MKLAGLIIFFMQNSIGSIPKFDYLNFQQIEIGDFSAWDWDSQSLIFWKFDVKLGVVPNDRQRSKFVLFHGPLSSQFKHEFENQDQWLPERSSLDSRIRSGTHQNWGLWEETKSKMKPEDFTIQSDYTANYHGNIEF